MVISLITIFVIAIGAAVIAFGIVLSKREEQEMYDNGIDALGVILDHEQLDDQFIVEGDLYVQYNDIEGNAHIGRLNFNGLLPIGTVVKIKYLPSNYKEVAFIADAKE